MSWQGLSLSFSGYDQRLPELAELVGDSLRTFSIEPLAFERQRDGLRRRLSGLEQRQPVAWVRGRGRGRGRGRVTVTVRGRGRVREGAWTQPRSLQLVELSSQKRQVAITWLG